MERILFLAHTQDDHKLSNQALEALTAAKQLKEKLGAELVAGVFGEQTATAVEKCGSDTVYTVEGEAFGHSRYATDAAACEALINSAEASIVIAPTTSRMSRVLPGVCHRVGGRIDTHVSGFNADGELAIERWFYRQRIQAEMSRTQRPWFLVVDNGIFEPFNASPGDATIQAVDVSVDEKLTRTKVEGLHKPETDEQTIKPDADVLFVAGAGWTKKQQDGEMKIEQAAKLITDFLKNSNASLGSSKSLVDLKGEGQAVLPFMTHLNQIGQTGSTPRHPKGLSTCCHGEEPHVVGWRFISERRAVNLDPNCGWAHGKADVLYVADAFKVMEEVNRLLEE